MTVDERVEVKAGGEGIGPEMQEHQQYDSDSGSESDDNRRRIFADVLESIRLGRVPSYCANVLRQQETWPAEQPIFEPDVGEQPMYGSFHVLFPVNFPEGPKWLLKVPACGTRSKFCKADSDALLSEAQTMKLLRRTTSIPIPEVYAFSCTVDNELGCPFILMEYISGTSLADCWFDKSCSQDELWQRRTRSLRDVAAAMAQLERFSFDSAGSVLFGTAGNPTDIGPMRLINHRATLEKAFGPESEESDDMVVYREAGPWRTVSTFYTRELDLEEEPAQTFRRGSLSLLRKLLQWIPEHSDTRKKFVLTHPDFDIQNFLVGQDGELKAIIDWDGVAAVLRSIGYESYPGWLTRDWDPAMYGWNESMEQGVEPVGCWEDSPAVLAQHRKDYEGFMRSSLASQRQKQSTMSHSSGDDEKVDSSISYTANSLYIENLLIATADPVCTSEIVLLFVRRIMAAAGKKPPEDSDIYDLVLALAEESPNGEREVLMKRGFMLLLENGA